MQATAKLEGKPIPQRQYTIRYSLQGRVGKSLPLFPAPPPPPPPHKKRIISLHVISVVDQKITKTDFHLLVKKTKQNKQSNKLTTTPLFTFDSFGRCEQKMIFWKELCYYTDSSLGMISVQIKKQQIRENQFLITTQISSLKKSYFRGFRNC